MAFTVNPLGIEGPPSDTRSFGEQFRLAKKFLFRFRRSRPPRQEGEAARSIPRACALPRVAAESA
jgi:hypothetical protein